jgi:hypothetical protein
MLAMGSVVFGQQLNNVQHRLSEMTDTPVKAEFQNSKRDVIGAGDIIFSEKFDSTLWHTANNDGVAVPANMPNGWTAVDNTGNNFFWRWSTTGPRGRYTSGANAAAFIPNNLHRPNSTSQNDPQGEKGFMMLEPDFYNTTSAGQPASPAISMDSYIQSRAIETTENPAVSIYFEQWHRFCCASYGATAGPKLYVSNNGTDWTQYAVHKAAVNATPKVNPSVVEMSISTVAAAQSTVYIRFHHIGQSHYHWSIDDVTVYEPVPYDTRVILYWADFGEERMSYYNHANVDKLFSNAPFYSAYHAFQKFVTSRALIQNFGGSPMTNVAITTKFMKEETNELHSATATPIATHAVGALDSIEITHNYQIPRVMGSVGAYHVAGLAHGAEEDELPLNNTFRYDFNITQNVFGFADPAYAPTDRQSPFSYVGAVDGDGVGVVFKLNVPVNTIAGTTIPAPYVVKGVNMHINSDVYNWEIWEAGEVAYLQVDLYQGTLNGTEYEYDFSAPVITSESTPIDSNMVRTWVYIPFTSDGAAENVVPTAEGHQYYVVVRMYTNGLRFFVGADKFTQSSYYSNLLCLGNAFGWTGATSSIAMELIVNDYGVNPTGTARFVVENENPNIPGVYHPATGAVLKFYSQTDMEAVESTYTLDNTGTVEIANLRSGTYAYTVTYQGELKRNGLTVIGSGVSEKYILFKKIGIESRPSLSGVKLYPNPTNNAVTIESPSAISRIVVSNIIGQVVDVISNPTQNHTLSVANYATGVYMVTLFDNSGNSTTQRLIKQ